MGSRIDQALERAQAFAERYAGKLAGSTARVSAEAMAELAEIHELVGRAGSYAGLRLLHRHRRPGERRAAAERPGAAGPQLETTLLFFELEWAALATSARRSCSRARASTSAATTCATRAATASTC